MINFDFQRVNSILQHHALGKWTTPVDVEREETRDNHEGDAKNRQESSYEEVLTALTDKLNHKYSRPMVFVV